VYRNYEFGSRNGEIVLAGTATVARSSGVRVRRGDGGGRRHSGVDEGRTGSLRG